jgi:hypothetical protein
MFDQHQYHDHPNWSPYLTYTNRSSLQSGLGIIQSLARGRMAGIPYGVTEFDFCYPNDWRAEGWVPMAAYARFQGWNFAASFAYNSQPWDSRAQSYGRTGEITGVWRFHNDPASFGQMPLTSLIFLRGDVRPARSTTDIAFSDADIFSPETGRFPPDPLRFLEDAAFIHRLRQVYAGERRDGTADRTVRSRRTAGSALPSPMLPPSPDGYRTSDTGELRYRRDPGIFVIDTPRTQGVVGFTGSAEHRTGDLEVRMENAFGSVVLTSLDGKPIRTSGRMLLIAVGRCQNTGFTRTPADSNPALYQANRATLGTAPILIDPIRFRLRFPEANKNRGLTAFALDGAGNRLRALPLQHDDGFETLSVTGSPATIYYELLR